MGPASIGWARRPLRRPRRGDRGVKQTTAKLVDVVYFLMKIKREDELIALINFVSRRDMRDINKIWRNTTPDLENGNSDEKKARARAQALGQHCHRAHRGRCYKCGRRDMWPPHAETTRPDA